MEPVEPSEAHLPDPQVSQLRSQSAALCVDDTFVDDHGDALFRYALQRVQDQTTAEDLVQETFLAAIQARDSFRRQSSVRTWLISILRHKILDRLRKECRGGQPDTSDDVIDRCFDQRGSWVHRPGKWSVDPASLLEQEEFWVVFKRCRDALPGQIQTAFSLRVMSEMKAEDVCKELQITSTNLHVMLHRARARLRACLEANWFQGKLRK